MASQPPHRLNPDTPLDQNLALINDNFDKVVQTVGDLGARTSSTTTVTFASVAAGGGFQQGIILIGPASTTPSFGSTISTAGTDSGASALTPQMDIYVDTDNNAAFLFPFGASLSAAQVNFTFGVVASSTIPTNTLAYFIINGYNRDVGAHTYFVHVRAAYLPAAPTGVFR